MSELPTKCRNLKIIFETGELKKEATVSKMEIVVKRGFRREVPVRKKDIFSL